MKYIIISLISVFVLGFFYVRATASGHQEYYSGEAAKQTLTFRALIAPPTQTFTTYPLIHESSGMFDFSSIAVYEAHSAWIDHIREKYNFKPDTDSVGVSMITKNLKYRKLDSMAEMISHEQWSHYSDGKVSGVWHDTPFEAHVELYVNNASNKVILHYHSFHWQRHDETTA